MKCLNSLLLKLSCRDGLAYEPGLPLGMVGVGDIDEWNC
jgi:hypothetical protein